MSDEHKPEADQAVISSEVRAVVDHLRHNRTTEREAQDLQEAARRSIVDHGVAKSLGRND